MNQHVGSVIVLPFDKHTLIFFPIGGNAKKRFTLCRKQRKSFNLCSILLLKGKNMAGKKGICRRKIYALIAIVCVFAVSCSTVSVENTEVRKTDIASPMPPAITVEEQLELPSPVIVDIPEVVIEHEEKEEMDDEIPFSLPFSGSELLGTIDAPARDDEGVIIHISLWETGERREKLEEAFRLYESLHPDVDIVTEFVDYPGYWGNISADIGAGRLADIIEMDREHIRQYSEKALIRDLSDYNPFLSGYGIALGFSAPVMLYDKVLLADAGIVLPDEFTLGAFEEIGSVLYEEYGLMTETSAGIGLLESLALWYGDDIYESILSGDTGYLTLYFSLIDHISSIPFFTSVQREDTWNRFASSVDIKEDDGILQLGHCTVEPEAFFSLTAASECPEEAIALISWLAASPDLLPLFRLSFGIPAFRSLDSISLDWSESKQLLYFEAVADDSAIPLPPAGNTEIALLLSEYSAKVSSGMPAEEASFLFLEEARDILIRAGGSAAV